MCESRGGRPGLPVPNKPTVSVDVKQNLNNKSKHQSESRRDQEEGGGAGPSS